MGGRSWLCVALALPLVPVAACGGGDEELGGTGALEAMLGQAPDHGSARDYVVYGNLARIREHADREPEADVEDELRALTDDVEQGWVVADPFRTSAALIEADETGFDLTEIDASLFVGNPPEALSVFTGRIEPDAVERSLTTFEPFADDVEEGEREGVATFRFGEEGEIAVDRTSPARPIGQNVRVGVTDGTVWWTASDAVLDSAIDAARGDGDDSLADDDAIAAVAAAFDDAGAYSVSLTGDPDSFVFDPAVILGPRATPEQVAAIEEELGDSGLARWEVGGIGEAFTDGGHDLVIVLEHADDGAAEENESALVEVLSDGNSLVTNSPWSDRCTDPSAERDGTLVTVRCALEVPGLSLQIFQTRELLMWR